MSKSAKKEVGAIVNKDGVSFRVWAPFANSVAVVGSFNDWGGEYPLESENDGYWHTNVGEAAAGQEYKFVISNGESKFWRNDPRALHLTTSAGNSVIASSSFDWGDDTFIPIPVEQQVLYEIHVGTFYRPDEAESGTFQDIIDKLDYLAELGINMIELMPMSSMPMDRGWGYAVDYIYAVESLYGGRHGFLKFVRAAHERGIGVILDVVYNHFGPDNGFDLWQFDGWNQDGKGGIYFYNDWRAETPWGSTRPDFGRQEVQQYILDNVRMWMHDCRVDGLRLDSTSFIRNVKGYNNDPGNDLPEGWHLMQRINELAHKINPNSLVIAEDWACNDYITKSVGEGGAGFSSSQWELNFPRVLRESLWTSDPNQINLAGITSELGRRYNNDAFQRIIYTDSHDNAANGSARLNEVVAPGDAEGLFARKQSLLAAGLLFTCPGRPMMFQGQEFMEDGSFTDWKALDWKRAKRHKGIIEAYQHLIALRLNKGGVSAGLLSQNLNLMHFDENNKVIAYHRWQNGGPKDDVVVIINFGDRDFGDYHINFPRNGTWRVRFNSAWKGYSPDFKETNVPDVNVVEYGNGSVVVPPSSVLILSQDE